jgi:hypothetical protein
MKFFGTFAYSASTAQADDNAKSERKGLEKRDEGRSCVVILAIWHYCDTVLIIGG